MLNVPENTGTRATRIELVELRRKLAALRLDLVGGMAMQLENDGDWFAWLPLLAQVESCIRAAATVAEDKGE